jgi:uncharacterized protein (DUF362 family)
LKEISRRELALMLGVGALAGSARAAGQKSNALRGVVGLAHAGAPVGEPLARETARRAISGALAGAVGAETGAAAAASLFSADDTVGIKLSCLAGRNLSPRVELVEALVDLLAGAGVDRRQIIVFERSSRELERAGFKLRKQGPPYRCTGTDNDYERRPSTSGAIGSCFARLVTTECTALVSFGVVKDHDLAGVSAGMKNWYGVIHNPNKYHQNGCDPYIADVARHPFIRDKLRLTVLDGVVAQCHGGPAFRSSATFPLGLVAASTDQVAADLWAWQEIEAERQRRGMPTLEEAGRPVHYLATAAQHGLGVDDPDRLRLVTA